MSTISIKKNQMKIISWIDSWYEGTLNNLSKDHNVTAQSNKDNSLTRLQFFASTSKLFLKAHSIL